MSIGFRANPIGDGDAFGSELMGVDMVGFPGGNRMDSFGAVDEIAFPEFVVKLLAPTPVCEGSGLERTGGPKDIGDSELASRVTGNQSGI